MFKSYVSNVQASKHPSHYENVLVSENSSACKAHPETIHKSKGQISNFSKLSNSVYQSNLTRKYRNISESKVNDNAIETQIKISQALKGKTMARNRTRIRT